MAALERSPSACAKSIHRETVRLRDGEAVLSHGGGSAPTFAAALFPPHPELGGGRDYPLLRSVEEAVAAAGGLALSLRYVRPEPARAVPEGLVLSDDRIHALVRPWSDASALLARLVDEAPVFGFGYSLGAHLLLLAAGNGFVRDLVLAAPPVARQTIPSVDRPEGRTLILAGDRDFLCPGDLASEFARCLGPRASVRILEGSDQRFGGDEDRVAAIALAHWGVAAGRVD